MCPHSISRQSKSSCPVSGISRFSSGSVTTVQPWWSSATLLTRVTLQREGDGGCTVQEQALITALGDYFFSHCMCMNTVLSVFVFVVYLQVLHHFLGTLALP